MKPLCRFAIVVALLLPWFSSQALEVPADLQAQLQKLQELPPEEREVLVQNLSESASIMQECIDNAGGAQALEALRELHNAHQIQVAEFCNSGHREQAQAYAKDVARELAQDQRVTKLHECSRRATQNMPQLSQLLEGGIDTSKHVCD